MRFEPDPELKRFLIEYDRTHGKMDATDKKRVSYDRAVRYRSKFTRLQTIRTRNHLTQDQLAFKAGISRRTITAIEHGKNEPSVFLALMLADALQCSVEELFHVKPPETFINDVHESYWTPVKPFGQKQ